MKILFLGIMTLCSLTLFSQTTPSDLDKVLSADRVMAQKFKLKGTIVVREYNNGKFRVTSETKIIDTKGVYYTAIDGTRNNISKAEPAAWVLDDGTEIEITGYSSGVRRPETICPYRYTSINIRPYIASSFDQASKNLEYIFSKQDFKDMTDELQALLRNQFSGSLNNIIVGSSNKTHLKFILLNSNRKEISLNLTLNPRTFYKIGRCGWKYIK